MSSLKKFPHGHPARLTAPDNADNDDKHASIPFTDYAITNETKEIIDWIKGKYFSLPSYF